MLWRYYRYYYRYTLTMDNAGQLPLGASLWAAICTSLDKLKIRWWCSMFKPNIPSILLCRHNWAFTVGFAWSCKIIFEQMPNLSSFQCSRFTCSKWNNKNSRKNAQRTQFLQSLQSNFIGGTWRKHHKCRIRRLTDRQTWAALGSLFLFPCIVWGIVLALRTLTQDVPWPQEWLLTKCPDWQS